MVIRFWGSNPDRDGSLIERMSAEARGVGIALTVEYVDVLGAVERALLARVQVTPTIDRVDLQPNLRVAAFADDAMSVLNSLLPAA